MCMARGSRRCHSARGRAQVTPLPIDRASDVPSERRGIDPTYEDYEDAIIRIEYHPYLEQCLSGTLRSIAAPDRQPIHLGW